MQLNFLGTGSAYNPIFKNTSAWFSLDDTLYLLDCGETVFETLFGSDILSKHSNIVIIITHFHSDHFGSLGSTISYCYCVLQKKVTVIYPEASICDLLKTVGIPDYMYTHCTSVQKPLEISAVSVQHDPTISCYGYLLRTNSSISFYGGDSAKIPDEIMASFESGAITTVYQDVTYLNTVPGAGHGSLESLCSQVPHHLRKNVVCMHLGHDFKEEILDQGFSLATPVQVPTA